MKVLIVEDEEALSSVLQEKFNNEGYETKIARDGEEVLGLAESFRPDMILLDLILPKKDGLAVLAELKANPKLKTMPVIVLSNLSGDESIKKALSLGAEDYYVKTQHPISEIVEKVEESIRKPK